MKRTSQWMEWQQLQQCHRKKHIKILLMQFLVIANQKMLHAQKV